MLVLLSGGVESTALLKYYLAETQEPVTAVHIYCPNELSKRAHLEWAAVERILPYLYAIRPFVFHRVDISFPFPVRDSEVQVTVLPALLRHTGERQFVRGHCLEDWHDEAGYQGPPMTPDTARARFGRRIAELVLGYLQYDNRGYPTAQHKPPATWQELSPYVPQMMYPKKWHMEYIKELLPLTWSCLSPVQDKPCGTCGTCRLINHR